MNAVNVPLLRKGLEWVEEQEALPVTRRRWNQASYVVSWRRWLLIQMPFAEYEEVVKQPETLALLNCRTACCFAGYVAQEAEPGFAERPVEFQNETARTVAIEHLGITEVEAERLFKSDNTAADIRRICEDIAGERL